MKARSLVVALVLSAASAVAGWMSVERMRETAFQAPGLVQVVHDGESGVARDLSQVDGLIRAQAPLAMVLRWLPDPVELVVEEPGGWLELWLGNPEKSVAALQISPDMARLRVRQDDGSSQGWRVDRPAGREFAFSFDGDAYQLRVDGELIEQPVPGARPVGAARIRFRPQASLRSVTCRTAGGDERLIRGPQLSSDAARAAWAGLTALLGLWALREWWLARSESSSRNGARSPWLLAAAIVVLLVSGLMSALREHNSGRLTVAPEPCAVDALVANTSLDVEPGRPLVLKARRDGDFDLTADIMLEGGTVLDVLLRGDPVERDRGILATLSTDPNMPVGLTRNLGTHLETVHASGRHRTLEPGRTLSLRVVCRDADTTLELGGDEVASIRDYDLRAGRTAFLALAGRATLANLKIQPTGQPVALKNVLLRWQWAVASVVVGGLMLLLFWLRGRISAVLWAWPLAAVMAPAAPAGAVVPCVVAAAILLLATPTRGRRLLGWLFGAAPIAAFLWTIHEQPPALTPTLLNDMRPTEVWGEPIPRAYVWARHPLTRRFNRYARSQQFRGELAPLKKTPGVTRLFTLGSSSTFGYGVSAEAAYPKRLEHRLREAGHRVEVFNAGVPGSTAARLALSLEGQLLPFAPDVIIVNLSFNDHIQGAIFDEGAHYEAMATTGIGAFGQLMQMLDEKSRLKSWARYFNAARHGERADPELIELHATEPALRFGNQLRRMVLTARSVGAEVVLVQEPPDPAAENTMVVPFHAAMAEVAAELDVPLVDPSQALLPGGDAIYLDAVHLTAEGHERMAAALADALRQAGLVD